MRARSLWPFILLALACIALFLAHLSIGSVDVPLRDVIGSFFITGDRSEFHMIVREVRLPQAITALLAGCGLAASGLMMQTLFRNPLAGPSVLGISSGASLGVALIMLAIILLGGVETFFSRQTRYFVEYPDAGGLIQGAKVMLNGIRVGVVDGVSLNTESRKVRMSMLVGRE